MTYLQNNYLRSRLYLSPYKQIQPMKLAIESIVEWLKVFILIYEDKVIDASKSKVSSPQCISQLQVTSSNPALADSLVDLLIYVPQEIEKVYPRSLHPVIATLLKHSICRTVI